MPQFQKARELIIKSGGIGKVYKVHLTWNRNTDRVQQEAAEHRSEDGRLEGVPRQRAASSRSTSTASATGAGSGTSAAASSPT